MTLPVRISPLRLLVVLALLLLSLSALFWTANSKAASFYSSPYSSVSFGGGGIAHILIQGGFTLRAQNAKVDAYADRGSVVRLSGITRDFKNGGTGGWANAYQAKSLVVSGSCPTLCQLSVKASTIKGIVSGCGEVTLVDGFGGYTRYGSGVKSAGIWPANDGVLSTIGLGSGLDFENGCGLYAAHDGAVVIIHAKR